MKKNLLKFCLAATVAILGVANANAQGKVFNESDETVVIEAEHYFELKEGSSNADYNFTGGVWSLQTATTGYTGDGYMQAPNFDGGIDTDADVIVAVSPAISFRVNFTNPGDYYWYARCTYDDGSSDSYHIGMGDSILFKKMNPYTQIGENFNSWGWNYNTAAGSEAIIRIPTAGEHDFIVYMREPNFKLDKILITTDPGLAPTGLDVAGPDETTYTGISVSEISNSMNVYPNPVTNQATISFDVLKQGNVNVSVYNLAGQKVKVLMDENASAGYRQIKWNVANDANVNPGIYFVKINNGGEFAVRKVVVQ